MKTEVELALVFRGWLESRRRQVLAFRREDNGDRSQWSNYNQGRADALEKAIRDVERLLSNAPSSHAGSEMET